jgi:hypothetical protein
VSGRPTRSSCSSSFDCRSSASSVTMSLRRSSRGRYRRTDLRS